MTQATIAVNDGYIESHVGTTPSTGPFAFDFPYWAPSEVKVETVADGAFLGTRLVVGIDYTIVGSPAYEDGSFGGGTITLLVAVTNATVRRFRDTRIERLSNFPLEGYFSRLALNADLNRFTMALQDFQRRLVDLGGADDGSGDPDARLATYLKVPDVDALIVTTTAAAVAVRGTHLLAWDALGNLTHTVATMAELEAAIDMALGPAGGDLQGTYPNPTIKPSVLAPYALDSDLTAYLPKTGGTVTGLLTLNSRLDVNATGVATIEVGGTTGAVIDMKSPFSDDFDLRFYTDGTVASISGVPLTIGNVTTLTAALAGTSITLSGGMTVGIGQRYTFQNRGYIDPLGDGIFGLSNAGATAGVRLDVGTTPGAIQVLNNAGGANNATVRAAFGFFDTSVTTAALTANGGPIVVDRTGDAAIASVVLAADAGRTDDIIFQTTVNPRWTIRKSATAEGGASAGSDFVIVAHDDAGASLGSAMVITRATRNIDLPGASLTGGPGTSRWQFNANTLSVYGPAATNVGILNVSDTDMIVRPTLAGSRLYLGAAGANEVLVGAGGIYPVTTKAKVLGNSAGVWNQLHIVANIFYGATSGTTTVQAPAVAGATTITLPAASGTLALLSDVAPALQTGVFQAFSPNAGSSTSTISQILPTVVSGNSGAWYSTVNGRYTPPAGRYKISGMFWGYSSGGNMSLQAWIAKNGTSVTANAPSVVTINANNIMTVAYECIVDANGTDYFQLQTLTSVAASQSFAMFHAHPVSTA